MEILSPEDRVVLWRSAIDAEGAERQALVRVIAREIVDSLSELDLHSDEDARLTLESLHTLDDAGLFASDGLRRCIEMLHEPEGGVDLLVADRRVRAVEMASEWREHVLGRRRPESEIVSVGDVAARYGVTTQAVYKWLRDGRIEATRGPGGSWRIPLAQFDRDSRPATSRRKLDELKRHLVAVQDGQELPSEDELTATMRDSD
jgi:excisionase family DNA binding protein